MSKTTAPTFSGQEIVIPITAVKQQQTMTICQDDYPLDWYQEAFIPYAEEYQALPDRQTETVLKWMADYIKPAQRYFGDTLLLLAHYYMGGEIVNTIQHFGGQIGDSYQLALKAARHAEKKIIVESAVHFMAESIAILAHDDQQVYITNAKAGCTMEMHAKDFMVEAALDNLNERYGKENILPICYMNTSGRVKALAGQQGGAVCTSSNVKKIFDWALQHNKKILFIPDQFMGENAAHWCDIPMNRVAYWPGGNDGANFTLHTQEAATVKQFDQAQLVIFSSHCSVHSYMRAAMVDYWKERGFTTLAHPECRYEVVSRVDGSGSTAFLWDYVTKDRARSKRYAIGTENHMVRNLKRLLAPQGFEIVNLGDAPLSGFKGMGCGCATMSRNDPPHLVAILDLLHHGKLPHHNRVHAGDSVNEFSGQLQRLDAEGQQWVRDNAKKALERMIAITED
ncbi:MAG: quinolinate synthase NadA [Gammaproteobacteria bacterium]|nr:quinolinate synthase NadA [Gammaproteobacteria bacterium]